MADFLRWHQEETMFLSIVKQKESEGTTLKVSYVEALQKLLYLSKVFNLYLIMWSHLLPREKHGNLRKEIDELSPFHIVTQDSFASGIVNNTNSKHVKLARDLQASDMQIRRTAQSVDDIERLLDITGMMQW